MGDSVWIRIAAFLGLGASQFEVAFLGGGVNFSIYDDKR